MEKAMPKAWDDAIDSGGIAAELIDDPFQPRWIIRVTACPDWYPNMKAYLNPAAAREMAEHLIALADEADRRDDELADARRV